MKSVVYKLHPNGAIIRTVPDSDEMLLVGHIKPIESKNEQVFVFENEDTQKYQSVIAKNLVGWNLTVSAFLTQDQYNAELAAQTEETPEQAEPEPPQSPQFGDKTPEYVRWLYKHDRLEFNRRYQVVEYLEDGRIVSIKKTCMTITPDEL